MKLADIIDDYCSVDENETSIKICKEKTNKNLDNKFKNLPLFEQGLKDAQIVNPIQLVNCLSSIMENQEYIQNIFMTADQ